VRPVSDFLARLAARAIGGEATLAPRLPSLFEPAPHAPTLPTVDDGAAATARHATAPADDASPAAEPLRPPRALPPMQDDALRQTPVAQPATRLPPPAAAPVSDRAMPVTAHAAPPATPTPALPAVARHAAPRPAPAHAEPPAAAPVLPRQTRIAPSRIEAASPPGGSLLPPPTPVFAAPRSAPARDRSDHAATIRPRPAAAANRTPATSEPVVHVSIGRLEVRAAPAAATPPRRRVEPRPASLDDYLRQRGGKASP
jgi:hypothetical protein